MSRCRSMNIYYECDVTDLDVASVLQWCDNHFRGNYNLIADSGVQAARGNGGHVVILLCDNFDDWCFFKLTWFQTDEHTLSLSHSTR